MNKAEEFAKTAEKLHKLEVEYATIPNILEDIAIALKDLGMDESEYKFLMSDIEILREKYDQQTKDGLPE